MTYRVTGNSSDAEEAAQEAFLLAYKKLPDFREHAAFGTWVYRIAMNCSLNLVKRRTRDLNWNATPLDPGPAAENLAVSRLVVIRIYPRRDFAVLNKDRHTGIFTRGRVDKMSVFN